MLLDDLEAEPRATIAQLERIYLKQRSRKNFDNEVAEAIGSGSGPLERTGTWMFVRRVEESGLPPTEIWERIIDHLGGLSTWHARVQLAQLFVVRPELFDAAPEAIAQCLRNWTQDKVPFVRAWVLSAWQALASRHPSYRREASRWLGRGRTDVAKSVQARIRRIDREGI